jgi:hypothetical protein
MQERIGFRAFFVSGSKEPEMFGSRDTAVMAPEAKAVFGALR